MAFELDPTLAADTLALGRLPLSLVRLHRDARYPWVLLIPERPSVKELHDLPREDRLMLIEESASVSAAMKSALSADKINVAALGNVVPQLHVHHVARYASDAAWPRPIWGALPAEVYTSETLGARIALLRAAFAAIDGFEG